MQDVSKMLPENAQLVSVNMDRGLYRILAENGNHHTFSLEKVKAKLEEAPQDIPHIVDFDDRFHDIYHIKAPRCRFIPALLVVENGKVSYMGQVEYWKDLASLPLFFQHQKKMRILESESELEELVSEIEDRMPIDAEINAAPAIEDVEVLRANAVSDAWLCFDKDKKYKKNGVDVVKCNQPSCGKELVLNPSTASNLARHVGKVHSILLPKKKKS
ncbi:hypothetical protein HK103_002907 [Boothiomyces macroporosus]|uniref:Uncharacterized protein n=1 Tax=Boothiomyces macroporosus TaxID=261099 RepID=A0AAD5Y2F2_9FUNG|nr:hypothetical protein HK103_002907 [Boothiomyces macroporosus]